MALFKSRGLGGLALFLLILITLNQIPVNANPCVPYPCSIHSTSCNSLVHPYACVCIAPYIGQNCTNTPCSPSPCLHGGSCTISGSSAVCTCAFGYYGSICQNTTNFCVPNPCHNGGTCTSTPGVGYTCTNCPTGYGGKNCTTCATNYQCVNAAGDFIDTNANCYHFCAYNICSYPQALGPCDSGTCTPENIITGSNPKTLNYTCVCDFGYTNANCSQCAPGFNFTSDHCDCTNQRPTPPLPPGPFVGEKNDPVQAWTIFGGIFGGVIALVLVMVLVNVLVGVSTVAGTGGAGVAGGVVGSGIGSGTGGTGAQEAEMSSLLGNNSTGNNNGLNTRNFNL